MIRLAPLSKDDPTRVAHIHVLPEQEPFCGTIAGHFADFDPAVDFHQISRDGRVVGFFKIDHAYPQRYEFAHPGEIGLRGVMIDRGEQGRGTGTAAMAMLRHYLPGLYPEPPALVLTVNAINPAAIAAYTRAGFTDTGERYLGGKIGPQHVMRMALR
ncbi:GNAT family N-acetyltransferase [uncultured Paracoccus sp.]|uniref:GNAT family N-acetyltransferase n=1 Tax=uncultured Paracoccus sp. TaxID=189685 RepID=UPI002621B49C|nr:GNAT family N-acetyltransferase [uncultured Paracoccus sp.]